MRKTIGNKIVNLVNLALKQMWKIYARELVVIFMH